MTKPVILTGIRANNDLHIGNYFGAMLPMIEMAKHRSDEYQVNLFIPDLHSFTTPIDHSDLQTQIMNNARLYTAAGLPLDNDDIHLYRQSYVPAHSELTWILDCFTGMGELGRMTQFKDKSRELGNKRNSQVTELMRILTEAKSNTTAFNLTPMPTEKLSRLSNILKELGKPKIANELEDINGEISKEIIDLLKEQIRLYEELKESSIGANSQVGLFNYPVLMAADILLYSTQYVPVGDDQTQHLEFTRDIAERINKKFDDILTVPEPVAKQHEFFGKGQGLRIKDLVDPTRKMSKSEESGKGVIFLGDDPEEAAKKIMSATTDDKAHVRLDRENQPGITNLLEILSLLRGHKIDDVAAEFEGMDRYGDFKKVVADEMKTFLTDFQSKLAQVDDEKVVAKLESSEKAMNIQANETLLKVQRAVGLRP